MTEKIQTNDYVLLKDFEHQVFWFSNIVENGEIIFKQPHRVLRGKKFLHGTYLVEFLSLDEVRLHKKEDDFILGLS